MTKLKLISWKQKKNGILTGNLNILFEMIFHLKLYFYGKYRKRSYSDKLPPKWKFYKTMSTEKWKRK